MERRRPFFARAAPFLLVFLGVGVAGCAGPGVGAAVDGDKNGSETVVAGLKEALLVGAERSVARAARPGGFLDDPRIRIPLPEPARAVAQGLRAVGFAGTVDDLEVAMNRAAEKASAHAMKLLAPAIEGLAIPDPGTVLDGPDDAATALFRSQSQDALRERYAPVVEQAMRVAGVRRAWDELLERNRVLDLLADPEVDLERYVTDEALAGLFTLIGEEEKRIRTEPTARTTDLLRRVFGSSGRSRSGTLRDLRGPTASKSTPTGATPWA